MAILANESKLQQDFMFAILATAAVVALGIAGGIGLTRVLSDTGAASLSNEIAAPLSIAPSNASGTALGSGTLGATTSSVALQGVSQIPATFSVSSAPENSAAAQTQPAAGASQLQPASQGPAAVR